MNTTRAAVTKLTAARARLVLERPFVGALVMHLPLEPAESPSCATVAIDSSAFYFNPAYVATADFDDLKFVLAHAALHCALGHFERRGHRTVRRWDAACDHAVNLLLIDDGLKAPAGALVNPQFRGMSAEEVYPLLPQDICEPTLEQHLQYRSDAGLTSTRRADHSGRRAAEDVADLRDVASGDSWDDAGNERRSNSAASTGTDSFERGKSMDPWPLRLAAAAQRAREAGRLSASWMRVLDELIQPALPWRALLGRYMMSAARDDYSYQRLSRRDGNALMPRLASGEVDLCIALDTSASIETDELAAFIAEIDAIKSQIRARVTVLACDERLDERCPWTFDAWESLALPAAFSGGGGTSFVPVFDWIARSRLRPDVLVYFTDAEGEFPMASPDYPVAWLVRGKGTVPWGERIQLN